MPFFCYERDHARRWRPIVYTERPANVKPDREPERSPVYEIEQADAEQFGALQRRFPPPTETTTNV